MRFTSKQRIINSVLQSTDNTVNNDKFGFEFPKPPSFFLWFSLLLLLLFLNLIEITLMDQDVVIDDVVDTQTFDLSELTENKTIKKTFKFRKVGEKNTFCLLV